MNLDSQFEIYNCRVLEAFRPPGPGSFEKGVDTHSLGWLVEGSSARGRHAGRPVLITGPTLETFLGVYNTCRSAEYHYRGSQTDLDQTARTWVLAINTR